MQLKLPHRLAAVPLALAALAAAVAGAGYIGAVPASTASSGKPTVSPTVLTARTPSAGPDPGIAWSRLTRVAMYEATNR
ncbi:MAG TPA: hypothetical protein VHO07_13450 [Streptosporangiaceae bacterium]|jgi:ABC-type glycerol-3-phosphate transport system substrate-binding protein|nr:hypothetical protein [Streptosporangiaceae bacterium]